jgi:DNA helicase-2/ATP-dependent DNA helicase PcrA
VIYTKVEEVASKVGTVLASATAPVDGERNPAEKIEITALWPQDFLGEQRTVFERTMSLVETAPVLNLSEVADDESGWFADARAIVAEYEEYRLGARDVPIPPRISTSTLIALHEDAATLAENIRRPMPRALDEFSHRGTAFHVWIESHFNAGTLFDDEDFDLLTPLAEDQKLEELKEKWLASDWANREPYAVEVPFETVIAGILVRGRIDAVYKTEAGFEVIDWKTGSSIGLGEAATNSGWLRLCCIPLCSYK